MRAFRISVENILWTCHGPDGPAFVIVFAIKYLDFVLLENFISTFKKAIQLSDRVVLRYKPVNKPNLHLCIIKNCYCLQFLLVMGQTSQTLESQII